MGRLVGQPLETQGARLYPLNSEIPPGTGGKCVADNLGTVPVSLNQQDIVGLVECTRNHLFGPRDQTKVSMFVSSLKDPQFASTLRTGCR